LAHDALGLGDQEVRPEPALPLAARALVASTLALGALVLAVALGDVPEWDGGDLAGGLGIALALVATERFQIFLPYGKEDVAYALSEVVWLAALFFARPSVLVLGVGLGVLIGQALQPWATVKVAFNVALTLLTVGAAVLVFDALGAPPPDDPAGWGAVLVAAVAHFVINAVFTSAIIALVEGRSLRSVAFVPTDPLHWAGSIALALLAALVWSVEPAATPLLLVPLTLTYLGYRGWTQSARERNVMDGLTREAAHLSRSGDVSQRLEVPVGTDAAARLGTTLNRMLDRIEATFQRERRFVSETSHELRTPITICRGYLEVLGDHPTAEELHETREVILDELDRMSRLVDDMRALNRVEDPATLKPAPVEVDRFVNELAAKASNLVDGQLQVVPPPSGTLTIDAQRVTQALMNLIKNARDHTPPGTPIRLAVQATRQTFRFSVGDRGGGLPPGREEEVFQPFVSGPGSHGSGLGLAIVAAVARAHEGRAGVDNRPGEGATFWIEVPA